MFTSLFLHPVTRRMMTGWLLSNCKRSAKFFIPVLCSWLFFHPLQAQVTQEWAKRYNNSMATGYDFTNALAVDAQGNVYVAGQTSGNTADSYDFTTVKYNAQGNQLWVKNYNGPANNADYAQAIAVDAQGNVYVSGFGKGNGTGDDYVTIKYSSQGNQLWVKRYNTPSNGNDEAQALGIDSQGNVIVVGRSYESNDEYPYTYTYSSVKYDAQGNQLGVKSYHTTSTALSVINDIALDTQANVYLTGSNTDDYVTVKYNAQGNKVWEKIYSVSAQSVQEAKEVTVDSQGNVYVTGNSADPFATNTNTYFTTIKYNAQGAQLWAKNFDTGFLYGQAIAVAVDQQGSVYVAGYNDLKHRLLKYDKQGNQLWVKPLVNDGIPAYSDFTLFTDSANNLYLTGGSAVTVKYDAQGNRTWIKDYSTMANGEDYAVAIATDTKGNVYVTGYSSSFGDLRNDYAIIKYDTQGKQLWLKQYNGPQNGEDKPVAMTVDKEGNVYVTGNSYGGGDPANPYDNNYNLDFATIKYDTQGNQLWVKRYSSANNGVEIVVGLNLDGQGNIYVTGGSTAIVGENAIAYTTIKYSPQGNQLWIKNPVTGYHPSVQTVDTQGNVYISANNYEYIITVKYDTQGKELWKKNFYGKNSYDWVTGIAVDTKGNVYITGSSSDLNQYYDYTSYFATVKYDSQGNELWAKYLYSAYSIDPEPAAKAIVVDSQGNVYITGASRMSEYPDRSLDYVTIKYNTQGSQQWVKIYNTPNNVNQVPTDIALDAQENVYVTGSGGTVKYNAQGDQLWAIGYDGNVTAITIDDQNNVYVTGTSPNAVTKADYLTIKYKQVISSCTASGSILREVWTNIQGTAVSTIPVNTSPDSSNQLSSFETPSNVGSSYGQRLRGYICAPINGNYTFYISGDNNCELYISTDDDPAKKVKIAYITGSAAWTAPRIWNKYATQKSVSIYLTADKKYYVEALHKENANGDNLAVGWVLPGQTAITVIPGSNLSPYVPTGTGTISREVWANVQGAVISSIPLNTSPTSTGEISSFEAPTNVTDSYGQRLRGYLHPQRSGNYTFYISGDNNCELWLSTDNDPANKTRIAHISGTLAWTPVRNWSKYISQKSVSIALVAGRKYYVEALHKENSNGDNLAIGWVLPNQTAITVIPGSNLSPFIINSMARFSQAEESKAITNLRIYPNPFNDRVTVQTSQQGSIDIKLTDYTGRTIYQATHIADGKDLNIDLSRTPLNVGVYFMSMHFEDGKTKIVKILKK